MATPTKSLPQLGLIGVGSMGSGIGARLIAARYPLIVYDMHVTNVNALHKLGAHRADSASSLAMASEIILISLPTSSTFVRVVEHELLPGLTKGKTVIDLGTTELSETRRIAEWFDARDVKFLDAPVSGSAHRARSGDLSIFAGGKRDVFERCLPIFKAIALGKTTYCGPAGSGQIVKGVEQLAMGLGNAAFLEALAFGVRHGMELSELWEALDQSNAARTTFEHTTRQLLTEGGEAVSVNYTELPYYTQSGQNLPLSSALVEYLKTAPSLNVERGHLVPSFWNQMTHQRKDFPCEGSLQEFKAGQPLSLPVRLDTEAAGARRAWIRAVMQGKIFKAWVEAGGKRLELQRVFSAAEGLPNWQAEIKPADLANVTALTFGADATGSEKCWLCSCGVVVHY